MGTAAERSNRAGAARDRDRVTFDLSIERIAADMQVFGDLGHVPMMLFDRLNQGLTLGTLQ